MLKKFLALFLTLGFFCSPILGQGVGPHRFFNGVQSWTVSGSTLDLNFSRNGGSCTFNRILRPCAQFFSVTRATPELVQWANGGWTSVGNNVLALSDLGLQVYEARTNKCTNYNANPTDLTGVTKSGDAAAVLSVVDDSAALAAAGLSQIATSGKVYKLDNSAGTGAAYIVFEGYPNNTNTHSVSAFIRGSGTANLRLGGTEGVARALTTAFTRYTSVLTPPASTSRMSLGATAGSVLYVVLNDLEEGLFATPPIVVVGAAATRQADVVTIAPSYLKYFLSAPITLLTKSLKGPALQPIVTLSDNTINNREYIFINATPTGTPVARTQVSGVAADAAVAANVNVGSPIVVNAVFASGDQAISANGSAVGTSASALPSGLTTAYIGNRGDGTAAFMNSAIQRLVVLPVRASNGTLQMSF